ncbi:MAG: twin-arginine translocase subunit TatC [Bacteroidia bacterium]|nr:twin-arginine translocase subunit TatC [Bacteroidia bacterium]
MQTDEPKKEKEMTFLEHLEVLRWHLIRSISAIFIIGVLLIFFPQFMFDHILFAPKSPDFISNVLLCKLSRLLHVDVLCINQKPLQIININMAGQFNMHMLVSFVGGLILAFPYVVFEIWQFLKPALYEKERKYVSSAIFYISLLFFIGILFGYFVIIPFTIHFLGSYVISTQILNQINLTSYISSISAVALSCGVIFELPVLIYFLAKIGIITHRFMKRYHRHAIIVILIVAAIITPPDVFSQTLVTIPLLALYEVSILIAKRVTKKREQEVV